MRYKFIPIVIFCTTKIRFYEDSGVCLPCLDNVYLCNDNTHKPAKAKPETAKFSRTAALLLACPPCLTMHETDIPFPLLKYNLLENDNFN